jgi:hypothetical protein
VDYYSSTEGVVEFLQGVVIGVVGVSTLPGDEPNIAVILALLEL